MRNFLIFLLSLFFAFILLNLFYLWILPKIDLDFSKTKETSRFRNEKFEILVLGNSTALDGVNSEVLASRLGDTYNLAVGGATLITNYIELTGYLKENKKPEKVLLFLSSGNNKYDTTTEVNPIVSYYYQHITYQRLLKDLPLFRFRWLFIENIKKLFSGAHRSAYIFKGQFRSDKIVEDVTVAEVSDSISNINYLASGFEYFRRLAELCEKEGIQLLTFEIPCWKQTQNHFDDTDVIFPNLKPVHIFNLNRTEICDTLFDSRNDWLSKNHLNHKGSIKLTNVIVDILSKEHSKFPEEISKD